MSAAVERIAASPPVVPLTEAVELNPKRERGSLSDDLEVSFVPMAAVEAATGRMDASTVRKYGDVKKATRSSAKPMCSSPRSRPAWRTARWPLLADCGTALVAAQQNFTFFDRGRALIRTTSTTLSQARAFVLRLRTT